MYNGFTDEDLKARHQSKSVSESDISSIRTEVFKKYNIWMNGYIRM